MDIQYLKEFVALAKEKQYYLASKCLYLSQSTLSRHIQALEKELGVLLFKRTTREVNLSKEGEIFLPYAQNILENYSLASSKLESYKKETQKVSTIGIIHNPEKWNVARYLADFYSAYKDVHFKIVEGTSSELFQKFKDNEIQAFTSVYLFGSKKPERFIPAGKSQLVAAISKSNPLSKKKHLTLQDLEGVPLFVPQANYFTYQAFKKRCEKESFMPNIVYEGNSNGINTLIKESNGVLLQDEHIMDDQFKESFALIPFEPEICYIYGLEYKKDLSKDEQTFVNYIASRCENLKL